MKHRSPDTQRSWPAKWSTVPLAIASFVTTAIILYGGAVLIAYWGLRYN